MYAYIEKFKSSRKPSRSLAASKSFKPIPLPKMILDSASAL